MLETSDDTIKCVTRESLIETVNKLFGIIAQQNDYITQTEITIELLNDEVQNLNEEVNCFDEDLSWSRYHS